jgi:hypothetical protein
MGSDNIAWTNTLASSRITYEYAANASTVTRTAPVYFSAPLQTK